MVVSVRYKMKKILFLFLWNLTFFLEYFHKKYSCYKEKVLKFVFGILHENQQTYHLSRETEFLWLRPYILAIWLDITLNSRDIHETFCLRLNLAESGKDFSCYEAPSHGQEITEYTICIV